MATFDDIINALKEFNISFELKKNVKRAYVRVYDKPSIIIDNDLVYVGLNLSRNVKVIISNRNRFTIYNTDRGISLEDIIVPEHKDNLLYNLLVHDVKYEVRKRKRKYYLVISSSE